MRAGATLITAANGWADICDLSLGGYAWLAALLRSRYRFSRGGRRVVAFTDEAILPSFERDTLRVLAGWDNWSRHYLLADNEPTDAFLRKFFEQHCRPRRAAA